MNVLELINMGTMLNIFDKYLLDNNFKINKSIINDFGSFIVN